MLIDTLNYAKQNFSNDAELFTKWEKCPICNSVKIKQSLTSHDNHYGIAGEYNHYKCLECGLLFLNPMPTDSFLSNAYPSDYYAYQKASGISGIRRILKRLTFLEWKTKDPKFKSPGRMLDIGCGSGEFLLKMREEGWDVYGVEPSQSAALIGREKFGLNIHNGTLLGTDYQDEYFDYIRLNHSLEHMTNPLENMSVVSRILKKGGKLFIGVPNTKSIAFRIFGQYWWNLGAPQHPINYDFKSLSGLVVPFGFEKSSAITNSHFTGLLGSYQIKANNKSNRRTDVGNILKFFPFMVIMGWLAKISDLFKQGDCLEMIFVKK